jgi:hypothetical protein
MRRRWNQATSWQQLSMTNQISYIFNVDIELGPDSALQTLGQSYTFTPPAVVQVTDVSVRSENYCEDIVRTFRDFYEWDAHVS